MTTGNNRIELEMPTGQVVVRHAGCPKGCNLMDEETRIDDLPSIHLNLEYNGEKTSIYLDPKYGSFDNVTKAKIPDDAVVTFSCPKCGVSLMNDDSCRKCSADLFVLHLPGGGIVEGCARKDCAQHNLRIVSSEQQMQRLFDDLGMDSYL